MLNIVVLSIKTNKIYYEATDMDDAYNNCPEGYRVRAVDDKELEKLMRRTY